MPMRKFGARTARGKRVGQNSVSFRPI